MSIEIFRSFETRLKEMEENHLIIFVKNPVLGKVKTRLAAGIGDAKALEIYLQLLELTRDAANETKCTRHVFYSDEIENDAWDDDRFNKHIQEGMDLGLRMKNAFEKVFALGTKKAVIIGSDCPQLTKDIIEESFEILYDKDTVIGPANDGGYYLLGMKKLHHILFENKEWSTDSVFEDTVHDLIENRLSYGKVEKLSDLDTIYDLHLLK
jgi:rSAM/selenodomain-associated transferase 1